MPENVKPMTEEELAKYREYLASDDSADIIRRQRDGDDDEMTYRFLATIDALRAQLDAATTQLVDHWRVLIAACETATKERDHWKANHTRELEVNRALRDRPDLGDRATLVQSLIEQRASLATALSERTRELDVAQKNNQELLNRIVKTDACWDAMRLERDAATRRAEGAQARIATLETALGALLAEAAAGRKCAIVTNGDYVVKSEYVEDLASARALVDSLDLIKE